MLMRWKQDGTSTDVYKTQRKGFGKTDRKQSLWNEIQKRRVEGSFIFSSTSFSYVLFVMNINFMFLCNNQQRKTVFS